MAEELSLYGILFRRCNTLSILDQQNIIMRPMEILGMYGLGAIVYILF